MYIVLKINLFIQKRKIKSFFLLKKLCRNEKALYICTRKRVGILAQLVEQRTENPCVPGSIPGGTTTFIKPQAFSLRFFLYNHNSLLIEYFSIT